MILEYERTCQILHYSSYFPVSISFSDSLLGFVYVISVCVCVFVSSVVDYTLPILLCYLNAGVAAGSGMAATTTICQMLKTGDHIVAVDDLYGGM